MDPFGTPETRKAVNEVARKVLESVLFPRPTIRVPPIITVDVVPASPGGESRAGSETCGAKNRD